MAFQARGLIQNAQGLPAEFQQFVGDNHAGGERGGAGAHAFADGNVVVYVQFDRRHGHACAWATDSAVCQMRLSGPVEWMGIAALDADAQRLARRKRQVR